MKLVWRRRFNVPRPRSERPSRDYSRLVLVGMILSNRFPGDWSYIAPVDQWVSESESE